MSRRPRVALGAIAACLAAIAFAGTATAGAASISYVGADGNVHLISPDGSRKHQVTKDGTASRPFESPSQADDGTVVAIGFGGEYTKFAQFFDPATGTLKDSRLLPHETGIGSFSGLTGGQVSPDGRFFTYDWADTRSGLRYATSLIGDSEVTDPCAIDCSYGWVSPRFVDSASTSLVIDPYLGEDGVGVKTFTSTTAWFNLTGDGSGDGVTSVDEAGRTLAMEYVRADDAGTMLDVLVDEPPTGLVLAKYAGAPGSSLPTGSCALADFSADPAFPRLSPDGSMLAWGAPDGVYVSPTPTAGGTCALQPKLIAPGGSRPDWGTADVPAGSGGGGGGGEAAGAACEKAKKQVAKAKKKLKKAKKAGNAAKVAKAKKKLKKAKKKRRTACANQRGEPR